MVLHYNILRCTTIFSTYKQALIWYCCCFAFEYYFFFLQVQLLFNNTHFRLNCIQLSGNRDNLVVSKNILQSFSTWINKVHLQSADQNLSEESLELIFGDLTTVPQHHHVLEHWVTLCKLSIRLAWIWWSAVWFFVTFHATRLLWLSCFGFLSLLRLNSW